MKKPALDRADFIFTIGYDGDAAVVDGQAKARYKGLSTRELAEKGLFRAAYSSALYSADREEIKLVESLYQKIAGSAGGSLDRLFGVFPVEARRSIVL